MSITSGPELNGHGRVVCKNCSTVLSQCRCINHGHKVTYVDSCKNCKTNTIIDKDARIAELEGKIAYLMTAEGIAEMRGIYYGEPCKRCSGRGIIVYGSTSTWRGGIGGQAMTPGPCDKCWGSGSEHHPWPSHRYFDAVPRCAQGCGQMMFMTGNTCKTCKDKLQAQIDQVGDNGRCHADRDGECNWKFCPQIRDKEPETSHRHCPYDTRQDDEW